MSKEWVNCLIGEVIKVGTSWNDLAYRRLCQDTCLGSSRNHFKATEDGLAIPVVCSERAKQSCFVRSGQLGSDLLNGRKQDIVSCQGQVKKAGNLD